MPGAAPNIDAHSFDWNIFYAQQEFLQWDDLPLPDGLPPENMLFSEYSNCEATPMNTGRQNLPNASERSTMSSPVSGIGGYSPKKSSTALVRRRSQNRVAQRAFRIRQKEYIEGLEQKLQSMVTKYNDLQLKYTGLSIAYETLANQKVPQTNGAGSSYMSIPSD